MFSTDSLRRLAIARALIPLADVPNAHFVAVVGSVARGIATEASDLDIAVFSKDTPAKRWGSLQRDGVRVEFEYFDLRRFNALVPGVIAKQDVIRVLGRIATSILLDGAPAEFSELKERVATVQPDPSDTAELLDRVFLNAAAASHERSNLNNRLWHIYAATMGLAILVLNRTRTRYAKPQWAVHDLREIDERDLLEVAASTMAVGTDLSMWYQRWEKTISTGIAYLLDTESIRINRRYELLVETIDDCRHYRTATDQLGGIYMSLYTVLLLRRYIIESAATASRDWRAFIRAWMTLASEGLLSGISQGSASSSLRKLLRRARSLAAQASGDLSGAVSTDLWSPYS